MLRPSQARRDTNSLTHLSRFELALISAYASGDLLNAEQKHEVVHHAYMATALIPPDTHHHAQTQALADIAARVTALAANHDITLDDIQCAASALRASWDRVQPAAFADAPADSYALLMEELTWRALR